MLKGNIGEWSEVYAFLNLLAYGKLNAADADLNIIPEIYYPIIKIIRNEKNSCREYLRNGSIKVLDGKSNDLIIKISIDDFVVQSQKLLEFLKSKEKNSDSDGILLFSEIEEFLKSVEVHSVKSKSDSKADIKIVVHDLFTGLKPKIGFSIKSLIGKKATLFNPGAGTNFIFKLIIPPKVIFNKDSFNKATFDKPRISRRLQQLDCDGIQLKFHDVQSQKFKLNLQLIDSNLPEILANMIYYKYFLKKNEIKDLMTELNKNNPLDFDMSQGHPFYEYKIKNFLVENALGMTPEAIWNGKYDSNGGMIVVKEDGDVVCYHVYNKNELEKYLINNTKIDQPSTSEDTDNPGFAKINSKKPFKFGWVYEENGEYFIKLNLQIRFI